MFSALLPDTASCKGFARPAATQQLPLELKLRRHNARSPFTPELAPYCRAFLPACVSTSPVAAVTSPGQPPAQPLTPRQRRLAQQRRKWEETQRQQQQQQPKQQTKQAAPVPKQAAAPTMGSGDDTQASSKAKAKAAGPSTPASAPSAGAPPHSRAFGAPDAAAAAASAAPATTRQQPQGQARAREQPQRQEGGWPSLFDRDATLPSGLGDLRALSGPQLASLARQWADELADWRQRQRQRDGSSAASRGPPAPADGALAAVPSSSSSSAAAAASSSAAAWQLPAAAASRLALLTAAVDSLLATHGSLGHQELADLAWCIEHYDREHALRWLHPAMGVPFRVVPQFMPGLRLEDFMSEVELRRDTIYLEDGSRAVEESRLTGWQSEIGATFKYSGKEMQPQPGGLSSNVLKVRDALRALTGVTYDSVLINYYADGKCGMRYHVDPLYDRWTPNSAVVSLGDTRTFIFREIQDHNTRWQYRVRNGDVVLMYGNCQDRLQHCVRVEKRAEDAGPRMSLVFKERLRGPTGQYLMP